VGAAALRRGARALARRSDRPRAGPYALPDGTTGALRVDRPGSHLRLSWQPEGWEQPSVVQLRVLPARTGTTIAFHQEHLAGPAEREAMLARWTGVLDALGARLSARGPADG